LNVDAVFAFMTAAAALDMHFCWLLVETLQHCSHP